MRAPKRRCHSPDLPPESRAAESTRRATHAYPHRHRRLEAVYLRIYWLPVVPPRLYPLGVSMFERDYRNLRFLCATSVFPSLSPVVNNVPPNHRDRREPSCTRLKSGHYQTGGFLDVNNSW